MGIKHITNSGYLVENSGCTGYSQAHMFCEHALSIKMHLLFAKCQENKRTAERAKLSTVDPICIPFEMPITFRICYLFVSADQKLNSSFVLSAWLPSKIVESSVPNNQLQVSKLITKISQLNFWTFAVNKAARALSHLTMVSSYHQQELGILKWHK